MTSFVVLFRGDASRPAPANHSNLRRDGRGFESIAVLILDPLNALGSLAVLILLAAAARARAAPRSLLAMSPPWPLDSHHGHSAFRGTSGWQRSLLASVREITGDFQRPRPEPQRLDDLLALCLRSSVRVVGR